MKTFGQIAHVMGGMTAVERSMGRFMRAPDEHPGGGEAAPAGEAATESNPNDMPGVEAPVEVQTDLAAELEKEFGQVESPATEETGEQGEGDPAPEGDKPTEKPESQKRFDELTAKAREAEREAEDAKREAEYWRKKAEGEAKPKGEEEAPKDPDAKPDPANFEYGEADPLYHEAIARHAAREEFREQQKVAETKAQLAELDAKWKANVAKAVDKYPDFDEVVVKGGKEAKWACSPLMTLGISDSDVGADIAYHLATNPAEALRIYHMDPLGQAREFGRLEGRFMNAGEKKEPPRVVTKAPPPPSSLARGSGGKFATPADTDDFASFERSADAMLGDSNG